MPATDESQKTSVKLTESDKEALVAMGGVYGIGGNDLAKIMTKAKQPVEVTEWGGREWEECGLSVDKVSKLRSGLAPENRRRLRQKLADCNAVAVTVYEPEYPKQLLAISSPPAVLFVRGKVERLQNEYVAVVGTRKPSGYGKESTRRIVAELAANGLGVVSGMALGVDACAHKAVLDNGGPTVAVLGSGIDQLLPASNYSLGKEIERDNVVVSEYAPGVPSMKQHFPARNRIVAGMALGVVVIEGASQSGTLITAKFALDQKKALWALPGQIDNELSQAPNELIKQGAKIITKPSDVVKELGKEGANLPVNKEYIKEEAAKLSGGEKLVFEIIKEGKKHVDEIIKLSGKSPAEVLGVVSILELKGLVRQVGGKEYVSV